MELARQLGKTPTEVNDYPGFVANRILMPMINEAIISLFEGVAGVEEIDTVMKLGMAHPMGPLQLADFIGLDVCLAILRVLHEGLGNPKYAPCPLLVNMVHGRPPRASKRARASTSLHRPARKTWWWLPTSPQIQTDLTDYADTLGWRQAD